MHQSMKASTLPQNPLLLNQIEQFVLDSNNLIRDGYYRKCIMHLDTQYKKLLPIECPLLLKIKVLRRLCYCTVMYFKSKINKGEINQGRNQFVLWSRLQLYIRDLHDNLSLLRIQFKKKYYMKELIFIIIKAFLFKSFYYQKIQLVARGLLSLHNQIGYLFQQTFVEKLPIFYCLQGKYNLIAGNSYFQLQNYTQALSFYQKALDLFQKNLEIVYKELTMTSLEEIKMTLKFYTKEIIITLFLQSLIYEQMNDFIKYQETIKMMIWVDQNYQPENSFGKIYLMNYIDQTKYIEFALETTEILKALKQALPEPEVIKTTKEEDQLLYYTNMLYEFDEYPKIKRQYYYYDKSSQPQYQLEANESEIFYDKSRTLKTNASAQIVYNKTSQNDNESTGIGKSTLMRTKLSENGLSTRFQTETEAYSQPSSTNFTQRKLKKKCNKEDMTLQMFYANAIEKSVKLQDIDVLTKKHNEELDVEQEETQLFDKQIVTSKQQIQFKKLFGSIGNNNENFQYSTRESRQKQRKLCSKSINQLQHLLNIQISLKTKTEQNQLLTNYNKQRKKFFQSTPDLFSKLQNQNNSLKRSEIELKNITQLNSANNQKREQDEEKVFQEIKISTKDTIKSFMDEKEQLISKPIAHPGASHVNQARNNMISERLIKNNDQLAFTTDQLSNSKKVNSLKTLLDVPRNNPTQKRMTTILTNITPRPQQRMGSHTILPVC